MVDFHGGLPWWFSRVVFQGGFPGRIPSMEISRVGLHGGFPEWISREDFHIEFPE